MNKKNYLTVELDLKRVKAYSAEEVNNTISILEYLSKIQDFSIINMNIERKTYDKYIEDSYRQANEYAQIPEEEDSYAKPLTGVLDDWGDDKNVDD